MHPKRRHALKVCKFGGSSVADASRIKEMARIVRDDSDRSFVVVSAPGKRDAKDHKITDLLYLSHELSTQDLDIGEAFDEIEERFGQIAGELAVSVDVSALLAGLRREIQEKASIDYVVSRGEYVCARIVADYLGAEFLDAADYVRIRESGLPDPWTYDGPLSRLDPAGFYVMPGFYGSDSTGKVRAFSRGGSDISGAVAARSLGAEVYENWTDVSGFLMADPRIVENPKPIRELTYREVRELAYMGAQVFHEEAIFPVYSVGIPINVRNTGVPEDPGTMIVSSRDSGAHAVAGIAGRTGFALIQIEKMLMNKELGFGRRLFEILETHDVSFEHAPSGIDTMSVIAAYSQLEGKTEGIFDDIKRVLGPDRIEIETGLALISIVGEGMTHRVGIAAGVFSALSQVGVNVRIIDQGSSEINITVGVEHADFEKAIRALHAALAG